MSWQPAIPGRVPLGPAQLHAWAISLEDSPGCAAAWMSLLDEAERTRAEAMATSRLRERYVLAHGGLRTVLAGYENTRPETLRFIAGDHGKPRLADSRGDLRFNLSHSGSLALVVVTPGREVGVDVEWRGAHRDLEAILTSLHPGECLDLARGGGPEADGALFRCWTRKEAYLKALGTGLRTAPDAFRVSAGPQDPPCLLEPAPEDDGRPWTFLDLDCGEDYSAAVVVEGEGVPVETFALAVD